MRLLLWLLPSLLAAQTYDIFLQRGRVLDPESGLDAVRSVGITGNKIAAVSTRLLRGEMEVDASGLVIAPGFIDLHQHSQTPAAYGFKAMDGVTTALELEVGVSPVSEWYAARESKSLINFGASSEHIPARMAVMHDTGGLLPRDAAMNRPATPEEQKAIEPRRDSQPVLPGCQIQATGVCSYAGGQCHSVFAGSDRGRRCGRGRPCMSCT